MVGPSGESPRPSPLRRGSTGSGSNADGTTTITNPNHCQKCNKNIVKSKPSLKCNCCHLSVHTTCLPDWTDISSTTELNKIISRAGLTWYCSNCQPKLTDYFYGPDIKPSFDQLDHKIDTLTRLMTENHKITKTYAQVTDESKGQNAEIKAIALRLDERTRREIQTRETLERKQSAILHNLPENVNTQSEVCVILQTLGFLPNSTTRISRLGTIRQNTSSAKPRPTKIHFHTEVMKIDFLRSFSSKIDQRHGLFVTLDLSKEEQVREYKLRQARNALSTKFSEHKYRIRGGNIQCQTSSSTTWNNVNSSEIAQTNPASDVHTDDSENNTIPAISTDLTHSDDS